MCNVEVVDPLFLGAANVNYPKSRDKLHSFPSSPHPMNVRLTILSCSASGQRGNRAMLIKFADQHFVEVLHAVHLYCERPSCVWFIIRLSVTVLLIYCIPVVCKPDPAVSTVSVCGFEVNRALSIQSSCLYWQNSSRAKLYTSINMQNLIKFSGAVPITRAEVLASCDHFAYFGRWHAKAEVFL